MLGRAQDPAIQALMRQMDTQSAHTLAAWAIACARARYLPLFEAACPGDARPRDALDASVYAAHGADLPAQDCDREAQREFAWLLDSLRAASVPDEPNPAKIRWNC